MMSKQIFLTAGSCGRVGGNAERDRACAISVSQPGTHFFFARFHKVIDLRADWKLPISLLRTGVTSVFVSNKSL